MKTPRELSAFIREQSLALGFSACGMAQAAATGREADALEKWLAAGYHGTMGYMERNQAKRADPRLLLEGTRTVISLALNYFPARMQHENACYRISRYAYAPDYHLIIKKKLKAFINLLRQEAGDILARGFTDSAPLLERAWAVRSGLGWIGKNGNLILPGKGSYFFLCEILTDLEVEYDLPFTGNGCGTCTRCLDRCPTQAFAGPYDLDARKCISFLTIESQEEIPADFRGKTQNWIFGCDTCQEVCPWNRFASPTQDPDLQPVELVLELQEKDWESLDSVTFEKLFGTSALKRAGYGGLARNIRFARQE